MTISKEAVLTLLGDRPIAYHPLLAKKLGGVEVAVFVSQLLYWTGRSKLTNGWLFKTQVEFEEETGLTRSNQETARTKLKKLGVLDEELRGVPATLHYRLNLDKLAELLQTSLRESRKLDCGNPANWIAGIPQTPETTTQTTPETTTTVTQPLKPKKEGKPKKAPVPITPAVKVHQEITSVFTITAYWREQMTTAVGDTEKSLQKWRDTLIAWTGRGFFGGNVQGQLEWFKTGVPAVGKKDTSGPNIREINGRNTLVIG